MALAFCVVIGIIFAFTTLSPSNAQLNSTTEQLQQCKDNAEILDSIVQLSLYLAEELELRKAIREVNKLGFDKVKFMERFVPRLYAADIDEIYPTIQSLVQLRCADYGNAVSVLFQEMRKQGHLTHPNVLVFEAYLYKCLDTDENVKSTAQLLQPHTDKILTKWAGYIQAGIFGHHNADDVWDSGASLRIPELIRKAYAKNTTYVAPILRYINGMRDASLKVRGYWTLVKELKANGKEHSEEMLLISHTVYDFVTMELARDDEDFIVNDIGLGLLVDEIPAVMRNIFLGSGCTIKNVHVDEYLYAVNDSVFTNKSLQVATEWSILAGTFSEDEQSPAEPPFEIENQVYFQIKNKNQYLCISNTTRVTTCSAKNVDDKWYLMPVYWKENTAAFKLKNRNLKDGGYVQVAADALTDGQGHTVDIVKESPNGSNIWQIDCAPRKLGLL